MKQIKTTLEFILKRKIKLSAVNCHSFESFSCFLSALCFVFFLYNPIDEKVEIVVGEGTLFGDA